MVTVGVDALLQVQNPELAEWKVVQVLPSCQNGDVSDNYPLVQFVLLTLDMSVYEIWIYANLTHR